jgi:similar to stage IV sporulation protein
MFLIRLWHYLKGYVIIIVNGQSVEKFINICTRRQILLWDMERVERNSVRMKMSIRGFKNARTAARKSRCRMRILEKKGFPFLFGKYKKRKGFVLGLIVFAVLIYFMTSIIWSIDITGNYHVKADKLIEQMSEYGIYRGASKRAIDPKFLADMLMLKNRQLSWVFMVFSMSLGARMSTPEANPRVSLYFLGAAPLEIIIKTNMREKNHNNIR